VGKSEKDKFNIVIYSNRGAIKDASRSAARPFNLEDEDLVYPASKVSCLKALQNAERSILILDWEVGTAEVLEILKAIRDDHQSYTVASFLVASQLDEYIIATGTEYGVSKVHTGDISSEKVKMVLNELVREVKFSSPLNKLLTAVSKARKKEDWETAEKILKQLMAKDPSNELVILELADNYIHTNKWQEAYRLLSPVKNLKNPHARALHLLGKCALKLRLYREASAILKKAKVINPYNIERLLELGNSLMNMGVTSEANENFEEVLKLDGKNKSAKKGKGTCLLMDGDVNEALKLLKGKISGSELASVFNTAAIISMRDGKIPAGMNLYDAALKAVGKEKETLARLYYNKGIGFFKWNKKVEAKQCFEKAVELNPNHENAKHNLHQLKVVPGTAVKVKKEKIQETPDDITSLNFDDSMEDFDGNFLKDEDEYV